jgi:hypothetical protein
MLVKVGSDEAAPRKLQVEEEKTADDDNVNNAFL